MARTDTLGNFLTDVADAIRTKKGSEELIAAADFDTEIEALSGGGGLDWEAIGYDEMPKSLQDNYDYAKNFYETWDPDTTSFSNSTDKLSRNTRLVYLPPIDMREMIGGGLFAKAFGRDDSTEVYFEQIGRIKAKPRGSAAYMCRNCDRLVKFDTRDFDTSEITDMSYMFQFCQKLTDIDVNNFNTANVTNMTSMFSQCRALKNIDVSEFNTSKVTNMSNMFQYCTRLETINVSSFNTTRVTDLSSMFSSCPNITNLDLSSFLTPLVTTMKSMFNGCSKLTELNFSNAETPALTKVSSMFVGCVALQKIDIRKFNLSAITSSTNYSNMFGVAASNGVPDNCEIIVKDDTEKSWITTNFSRLTNVKTVAEYEAEQNA